VAAAKTPKKAPTPRRAARPARRTASRPAAPKPSARATAPAAPPRGNLVRNPPPRASLDRQRRRLSDIEVTSDDRSRAAAETGHHELIEALERHTESSPVLTGGDVDAKWEDAYAVGDEAPGGDNPTPDQDRVDDIGRALGVTYDDAEELRPNDKVADRDHHRWELDPASSDDWPHDGGKDGK
jgi:hypothetical protein